MLQMQAFLPAPVSSFFICLCLPFPHALHVCFVVVAVPVVKRHRKTSGLTSAHALLLLLLLLATAAKEGGHQKSLHPISRVIYISI